MFGKVIEIPEEWEYPKFISVVKVNPITPINAKTVCYVPMDAVNTDIGEINYFESRAILDHPSLSKFLEYDVLFARITPSTENGKTAFVENFQGIGIASSELTVLRACKKITPKYLYYYMKSYRIRSFAISQMLGTTNRQRVPDYVFKKDLNFELPPLPEQQKIASILCSVDALIESTGNIIEKTERLKKGLMHELLTRGIGHDKFKKVKWMFRKEIKIPKEWEITKFKIHCTMYVPMRNKPKKFDGDIPWLRIEDLDGKFASDTRSGQYVTYSTVKEMNLKIYPIGTVICSCSATIGVCAITTRELITNQTFIGIFPDSRINNEFLYYYLNTQKNNLIKLGSGSTILYISRKKFEEFIIILPNINEQQKIASILSGVDAYIQKNQEYKKKLETLKKGLMQKLLTGKIRVKV